MAARSLLDRDGTNARQAPSPSLDTPATRDFPQLSRDFRLGLGDGATRTPVSDDAALNANASTTEIMVTSSDVDYDDEPSAAPVRTKPKHRLQAPSSALKARTALFAIAAGATAIAVTGSGADGQPSPVAAAPADPAPVDGNSVTPVANVSDTGPGVVDSAPQADMSDFGAQLQQGVKIAKEQAAAIAAAQKPLVVSPIKLGIYQLTSAFAPRWGTFHGGIDMAAPLGTPIHAATDGVVVAAGPASGYGHWIQIKAADGTMTMYGHMASSGVLVQKGQKVTAGDVIGLVGSEGFSTGPHLHFEHWIPKGGSMVKVDPAIWLAKQGVRLSTLVG